MTKHTYVEGSGGFDKLVPGDWFEHPEDSSIWLRIYTCLFVPHATLADSIRSWLPQPDEPADFLDFGAPILFGFGTVKDFKVPVQTIDLYSQESGQTVLAVNVGERTLPAATYIFLATPYRKDGTLGNEPAAKRTLDLAAGLLCLHAGLNFMRDCVFEGEASAGDNKLSIPGQPKKVPKPAEGPFLGRQNGADVGEISERLSKTREPKKGRIELALRLMGTAMREDQGFFEYWTALEVVCDGKSNRIKERLGKLYGLKSHKEAAELLGLGTLVKWRGDYVHGGKAPSLTADIERYLQLLFLDLLRHELDLPTRSHAVALRQASGYDLSPLGLRDNRIEEQKKAAAMADASSSTLDRCSEPPPL